MNRPNICVSIDNVLNAAHRPKKRRIFPIFILYFIYDFFVYVRPPHQRSTGSANEFGGRLCDLQNFISITNIP